MQHLALLWSGEALVARISSQRQALSDLTIEALALAVLVAGAAAVSRRAQGRQTRVLQNLALLCPLAVVVGGLVLPRVFWSRSPSVTLLTGLIVVSLVVAVAVIRARAAEASWPSPWLVTASLFVAAVSAWMLAGKGLPAWPVLSGLAVALAATTLLLKSRVSLFAIPALIAVLAAAPLPRSEIHWPGEGALTHRADVLLITVDTLRADHAQQMRSYRRLARDGIAFSAASAPSPWTLPSMATLMTGLPVNQHGALRLPSGRGRIASEIPTLASRLQSIGYDTAAVVGPNDWLGPTFGFDRGFAVFEQPHAQHRLALPRLDRMGPARPLLADVVAVLKRGREASGNAEELLFHARRILAARRDRPLFLWVHFYDCHLPYFHADQSDLPLRQRYALDLGLGRADVLAGPFWSSRKGIEAIDRAYRHEIGIIDDAILDLLDAVERRGDSKRIVILTSDHGEEFFEHGGFEHGHSFYQEVLQVPLVISTAGSGSAGRGARLQSVPVGLVDIVPTILGQIGEPDGNLPGQELEGTPSLRRYVMQNLLHDAPPDAGFAVREGNWKGIFWAGKGDQLFRLDLDPAEKRNLAREHGEILDRLAEAWQPTDPGSVEAVELDEEVRDSLRALGYLD